MSCPIAATGLSVISGKWKVYPITISNLIWPSSSAKKVPEIVPSVGRIESCSAGKSVE
jgi:hypothetical protein